MNRSVLFGGLIAAPLCLQFAQAESTQPDEHRVEVLATMLAAYVSCDSRAKIKRDVKTEIIGFEASTDEAALALATLSENTMACRSVRKYAASLAEMAETNETGFVKTLGLPEVMPIEAKSVKRDVVAVRKDIMSLTMADLPPPPSNSNRHIGSDY